MVPTDAKYQYIASQELACQAQVAGCPSFPDAGHTLNLFQMKAGMVPVRLHAIHGIQDRAPVLGLEFVVGADKSARKLDRHASPPVVSSVVSCPFSSSAAAAALRRASDAVSPGRLATTRP